MMFGGGTARDLLLSGTLDCAIIARREPLPDRFETTPLMTESFELAYAHDHPISKKDVLEINDLNGLKYLDRLRCEFRGSIFGLASVQGLEIDVIMRSEREDWIQNMVASGMGVTMMPRNSIVVEGISTRPVAGLPVERTVEIVTVSGRALRNNVSRFVDFLKVFEW